MLVIHSWGAVSKFKRAAIMKVKVEDNKREATLPRRSKGKGQQSVKGAGQMTRKAF